MVYLRVIFSIYFIYRIISILPFIGLILIYIQTPLRIGFMVVTQSFFIRVVLYLKGGRSWFSYLLLMVFLRGIIIIFIYVSSLAVNEISFYTNNIYVYLPVFIIISYILFEWQGLLFSYIRETMSREYSLFSYKVYRSSLYILTSFIIIYLLVALLVVIKNRVIVEGPLRSKK